MKKVVKKSPSRTSGKITKKSVSDYMKTGIQGFDRLFKGDFGIPSGSAVLVEGGPGSGKTMFCLSTVMNLCKKEKKCLYMSFEEPEARLIEHAGHFNWPAEDYIKKGLLRVKRFNAIDISRSVEALLSEAKKELLIEVNPVFFPKDFQPDFVVVDSLTSIASSCQALYSFRYTCKTLSIATAASTTSLLRLTFSNTGISNFTEPFLPCTVDFTVTPNVLVLNFFSNHAPKEAPVNLKCTNSY